MKKLIQILILAASFATLAFASVSGSGPATGLISNSTLVSTVAASAPSAGQVLTAASGTAATWQTLSVPASGVTGVLPIANGGTGNTTYLTPVNNCNPITWYDGTKLSTNSVVTDLCYDNVADSVYTGAIHISNALTTTATFTNTGVQGALGGSGMIGYSDPGAAITSGSRLGFYLSGGSIDSAHTLANPVGIAGFATENFSATNQGADLRVYTTPNGSTTSARRVVATFGQDGSLSAISGVSATSLTSTVATGTAPLTVASTTRVANLNVATAGNADATPLSGVTGLGTGVASALAENVGSAGAMLTTATGAALAGNASQDFAAKTVTANLAGSINSAATVGGTADAITLATPRPITSYTSAVGSHGTFVASGTNTVMPTIAIDGLAALNTTMGGIATPMGMVVSGEKYNWYLESATSIAIAPRSTLGVVAGNPSLGKNGLASFSITTQDSTTASYAGVGAYSPTSTALVAAHSAARVVTRYGVTVASYGELLSLTGNGLLIGTGTNNTPVIFGTNSLEVARITGTQFNVTGSISTTTTIKSSGATSGIGYATGAGSTVTQTTSRTTGVTLSYVSGTITTDTTSLAAGAYEDFTVTNTNVAITDDVRITVRSGSNSGNTSVRVYSVAAGSFVVRVWNQALVTAETGAIVFNVNIFKGVAS